MADGVTRTKGHDVESNRQQFFSLMGRHLSGLYHIEEDVPETPPQQFVSTLGDEILDFHEPDEDLKLEDIVPDLKVPTPEQETEAAELRRCLDEALAGLPGTWRRAVLLRHVNGLAGTALARAVGRPEAETDRMLDHARAYLRQRLVESGCAFQGADGR